ncbi:hypothetical protein [Lysinibacillus agricola]|uniref:hypothetical protein n=1 Tax=Lysinibacillus agricola TaxID=2590012 RepID=UPI003C16FBE3
MAYDLEPAIKDVLEKINFIARYKDMSLKFSDRENTFENYGNGKVMEVFESMGYKARYMRGENFFIVGEVKNKDVYKFKFNVSLEYGMVELIWSTWHEGNVRVGDPWGMLVTLLSNDTEKILRPCFHSYEELKEIMGIAIEMYEDFKRELIAVYCP